MCESHLKVNIFCFPPKSAPLPIMCGNFMNNNIVILIDQATDLGMALDSQISHDSSKVLNLWYENFEVCLTPTSSHFHHNPVFMLPPYLIQIEIMAAHLVFLSLSLFPKSVISSISMILLNIVRS